MANIHNLIVKYDSTSPREGSFPIDLNCGTPEVNKVITAGIYDLNFTPPKKVTSFVGENTVMLTRLDGCDGSYILVEDSFGHVNSLVISLCDFCVEEETTTLDYTALLTEIRDELLNDDSYQLFEDTDGNILFGKIDNDGIIKYYKPDGTIYTGVVKPYSSGVITSSTDYCANSVPYTLIQFRDVDTKQVVATIWRNDNTLEESSTAPLGPTKGACVVFAQDTFQAKDCAGNNIGGLQDVLKVVQLNKQIASVCNTSDISDPIIAAIEDNAPQITNGKRHSLITYTAVAGDILTINPVFSTISMLVSKGEFHVENTSNDFRSDMDKGSGSWVKYIALSADGLGTASGATDLPQSLDTRANSKDLEPLLNSYLVGCIRDGVIQLELYKD